MNSDEYADEVREKGGEVDEDSDHPVHEEFTKEEDELKG